MEFSFPPHVIDVNMPSASALLTEVQRRLGAGQGFALATINLDHLVKLASDTGFREIYAAQDLVCADGNPIVWLSRLARKPVELVPGSDMVEPLARLAAEMRIPVALFGSTDDSLAAASRALQTRAPGLQIVSAIAPPMGFDAGGTTAREMLQQIEASGARMVFIALGAPKQETFAALGREVTPGLGFVSIGAGLDFLSGQQTRAPKWVRAIAMEWLWRMLSNPARLFKRYAQCALILPGHAVRALRQR